ncbi:MAG: hypothetical protein NVS9B9_26700 [Ktedonobacteraceae bacterium]
MKRIIVAIAFILIAATVLAFSTRTYAATCSPTGFIRDGINMTAALINPSGVVSGDIDATGCNIGVYYDNGTDSVNGATIHGANYFGIVVNGDVNNVSVDVQNSNIHDIGENPLNGTQHGVAVYYRDFGTGSTAGKIWNNTIYNYQKGGIVTNGTGTTVDIKGNTVTGQGPVAYIAQNGIQIGYGASAQVIGNTVTGNSYTGSSTVSGGIIVVGGPGYGLCVGTTPCAYTTGTIIDENTVTNNDVGVFLTNLAADGSAPLTQTNVKVVNNIISDSAVTNGLVYQAGVSDVGNNDKIINNNISGLGYTPVVGDVPYLRFIDADASFTNNAKVHANVTP